MQSRTSYLVLVLAACVVTPPVVADQASSAAPEVLPQEEHPFTNLEVLPKDISDDELDEVMLANLRGLGLPRRQSQGCLFCHVGDSETPSASWDFASDGKPEKRKAREMMAMVADINRRLAGLEDRVAPDLAVTCYTCHAGRTDPRPLPELLMASYESGGVDRLVASYRGLRERYYGADAYDFRPSVLSGLAIGLADSGAFDDALAVANLNAEFFADVADIGETGQVIRLERVVAASDIGEALAKFDLMRSTEEVSWSVLDWFGWRLSRRGEPTDAVEVFRHNLDVFPEQYIPNESMGDALWIILEDLDAAIALFDKWLEAHPDHVMARRRVATLRAERIVTPRVVADQTFTVEPNHSSIGFEIPISGGITRVTGKFMQFEIELHYPDADVLQWSVEATIQSGSVDTGIDDRDAHLSSPMFFDAANHPEIRFKSRRIEKQGDDAYVAHGDLTMRGVTHPFSLPFEITGIKYDAESAVRTIGFRARGTLNRHDFGVGSEFQHTLVKNFLGDEVTLEIYCYLRAEKPPSEAQRE